MADHGWRSYRGEDLKQFRRLKGFEVGQRSAQIYLLKSLLWALCDQKGEDEERLVQATTVRSGGGLDCAEGGRWGKKMLEWDIYFEGRVKWPCCWLA